MVINVNPKPLVEIFTDFVRNSKVMFNFKTDGKTLHIQVLSDYTVTTSIPVDSVDGDYHETDISVWVTKCIHILNDDEYIHMTINDAALVIEQSKFNCVMLREYESRRELPSLDNIELKPAFANRLKYLAHASVSCMSMARELSIADPDPVFANGKFYMHYNQAAFIDSINYPQMSIPFSTLRDFAYKLNAEAQYAYLTDIDTLYIKSDKYEFWVPTSNYNINNNIISTLDKKLAGCVEVTTLSIKSYRDKFSIIADSFPKQKLAVSIGEHQISIAASANNYNVGVGDKVVKQLVTFMVTSAQLSTICKLFDDDEISIRKGVGCICLTSGEKTLMIAGVAY